MRGSFEAQQPTHFGVFIISELAAVWSPGFPDFHQTHVYIHSQKFTLHMKGNFEVQQPTKFGVFIILSWS